MALAPLRKCAEPGCRQVVRSNRCDKHKKQKRTRGTSANYQHLYGSKWKKAAARFKRLNPLCVECEKEGVTTAAYCVDHIVPHKGSVELFWDQENNWQVLCERHHNRKTARGL